MSTSPSATLPRFAFLTPRALPPASKIDGRVAVLDVAFASEGGGASFEKTTLPFIKGLGGRLAAWVDHHDHDRHVDYKDDPRFVLTTKAQHGACPELVTPEVVRAAGPVDTVAMHLDLDGLYSGAKWVLGGVEPYPGADDDARAVDTRRGEPGPIATRIDRALRARFRDETLKHRVIQYLVSHAKSPVLWTEIEEAAREIDPLLDESKRLAERYQIIQGVAYVESGGRPYDKTELLLLGQERSPAAVVRDSGALTIAADFESGLDFVKMFDLGGGMPTRVTVPEARHAEVMSKLAAAVAARARPPGAERA
ncbi:MAG TPA: hypothetical protein VKZ18_26950 [Polyangia bacterium]|nr:hypothetical protein [Polyangia bacterium]